MILKMVSELLHNPARLVKLNKTVAFHRLLVIFIASNSAYYVILPCLDMLERCMTTTGVDGFLRSFESEGGFALLSQVLPSIWRHDIQAYILRMFLGKDEGKHNLACPQLLTCLLTSLDVLLQSGGDEEGFRPTPGRTRSGTITSVRSVVMSPLISSKSHIDDNNSDLTFSRAKWKCGSWDDLDRDAHWAHQSIQDFALLQEGHDGKADRGYAARSCRICRCLCCARITLRRSAKKSGSRLVGRPYRPVEVAKIAHYANETHRGATSLTSSNLWTRISCSFTDSRVSTIHLRLFLPVSNVYAHEASL